MLVNFWTSSELRQNYEVSFSYRDSKAYTVGLRNRAELDFQVYPLQLPDMPSILGAPSATPRRWVGVLRALAGAMLLYPMFLFDVFILTCLFRRIRPDVLHINNGGYPGALSARAAAVAAKLCRIKNVLMVVNNLAIPYKSYSRWMDYPIDRLVARCVDMFVTGSKAAADCLRQVLNIKQEKIVSLHNGVVRRDIGETVAETRLRLGLGDFNGVLFGVVALMEERKGHRILLDALVLLSRTDPSILSNMKFLLEGDGPLREELERFVAIHDLGGNVQFVGAERNVFDFIHALDVLVLPSIRNEDFPNVILEAMSLRKPVIASALAGTPEQVVDGVTGILTSAGDSVSLANALKALAIDDALRKAFGEKALQRFEELFTVNKAVGRYLSLYKKMIGANL